MAAAWQRVVEIDDVVAVQARYKRECESDLHDLPTTWQYERRMKESEFRTLDGKRLGPGKSDNFAFGYLYVIPLSLEWKTPDFSGVLKLVQGMCHSQPLNISRLRIASARMSHEAFLTRRIRVGKHV